MELEMGMKVIVLGAGLVGAPMALDLAKDPGFEVTAADVNQSSLRALKSKDPQIETIQRDLSDPGEVTSLVADYDLVLSAVPGFMGYETAKAIIQAGKDCVDIAFYEEDPFTLDELAQAKNVTMVMDCGVCPGMNNVLIMKAIRQLDQTESVVTYVGGLPVVREWPTEYKAVFSPIDVIEEYTRPARIIEHGMKVRKPALSEPEFIFFPGVGTLEAFNTDGLRTMLQTVPAANMKEKTLRYPGHIEKMGVLRDLGFFSKEPSIDIEGKKVSPLEMTAQILFPHWTLAPGEADLTIYKCVITGSKDGQKREITFDMLDHYDPESDVTSMARTTGYTATLALRLIAEGQYTQKGISPPEYLGKHPGCVDFLLQGLKARGIEYQESVARI